MVAASLNSNYEVLLLLIESGADVRAKNNEGYTALDLARSNENLKGIDIYNRPVH